MRRQHEFDLNLPEQPEREESSPGMGRGEGGSTAAHVNSRERRLYLAHPERGPAYYLRDTEMRTLRAVGAFRMVDGEHLSKSAVDALVQQGLATRERLMLRLGEPNRMLVVLTKKGGKLVRAHPLPGSRQQYYSGIVRRREIRHDLALYPEFRKNAKEIEGRGGRVQRVVLDYELKSHMAKRMNAPPADHAGEFRGVSEEIKGSRRREIAAELDLPVVDGHLKLPDVRIEYEDEHGQERHLDLEITTEHYKGQRMATKRQAGFKMSGVKDPRAKVRDDHHNNFF